MPLNNIDSSKYLSLKNAAELYGYTRDHLGLMIRKGKLNGIKLGSYYVTTNNWMIDYVKNFADPNHPTSKSKLSNKFLIEIQKTKAYSILKEAGIKPANSVNNKIENPTVPSKASAGLSEELSELSQSLQYLAQINNKTYSLPSVKNINSENYEPKADIDRTYVILPIREMNTDEREKILSRIGGKENKTI